MIPFTACRTAPISSRASAIAKRSTDARIFSSDKKVEFDPKYGDTPLFEHHTTSLVFNDPPLHTHVRRAIQAALSNRAIAEMEAGWSNWSTAC